MAENVQISSFFRKFKTLCRFFVRVPCSPSEAGARDVSFAIIPTFILHRLRDFGSVDVSESRRRDEPVLPAVSCVASYFVIARGALGL
jgi:hypothetical protein